MLLLKFEVALSLAGFPANVFCHIRRSSYTFQNRYKPSVNKQNRLSAIKLWTRLLWNEIFFLCMGESNFITLTYLPRKSTKKSRRKFFLLFSLRFMLFCYSNSNRPKWNRSKFVSNKIGMKIKIKMSPKNREYEWSNRYIRCTVAGIKFHDHFLCSRHRW